MTLEELNFIITTNDSYIKFSIVSIKKIKKLYPNSNIFVYDWGLSEENKNRLENFTNLKIIDWTKKFDKKSGAQRIIYDKSVKIKKPRRDYVWNQKPICILDCSRRINKNLIYIDSDAFLIQKIDELISDEFDIGITAILSQELYEESMKKGIDSRINAGIIFFLTSSEKIEVFVKKWIEILKETHCYLAEQTALIKTIKDKEGNLFEGYFNENKISISGYDIIVRLLPYYIYNYFENEKRYDYTKAKLIHLLSGSLDKIPHKILEFKLYHFLESFLKLLPLKIKEMIIENIKINYIADFLIEKNKFKKIGEYWKKKNNLLNSLKKVGKSIILHN